MLVTAEMLAHSRGSGLTLRFARVMLLKQDARRGLVVAAAPDHLDRAMQVCLAGGELLGERKRETGLHQHVETPAFDFRSLVLWCLGYLRHEVRSASPSPRRTLPLEVCAVRLRGTKRAFEARLCRVDRGFEPACQVEHASLEHLAL